MCCKMHVCMYVLQQLYYYTPFTYACDTRAQIYSNLNLPSKFKLKPAGKDLEGRVYVSHFRVFIVVVVFVVVAQSPKGGHLKTNTPE